MHGWMDGRMDESIDGRVDAWMYVKYLHVSHRKLSIRNEHLIDLCVCLSIVDIGTCKQARALVTAGNVESALPLLAEACPCMSRKHCLKVPCTSVTEGQASSVTRTVDIRITQGVSVVT